MNRGVIHIVLVVLALVALVYGIYLAARGVSQFLVNRNPESTSCGLGFERLRTYTTGC